MSTELLTKESLVGQDDFTAFNILVFGQMAAVYGTNAPGSPVRGWGNDEKGRTLSVGNHRYSMAPARKGGVIGLRMTVRNWDDGEVSMDKFIPWEVLNKVKCEIPMEDYA